MIVGKRALPAMRLADPAAVALFGGADDIAMGIAADDDGPVAAGLAAATGRGLLTVALAAAGTDVAGVPGLDHLLAVTSDDPRVVREGHVTTYHVLWELVHVFLEAGVV